MIPVGHVLVLHLRAWIQPRLNKNALAELHTSAPKHMLLNKFMPVKCFPLAIRAIFDFDLSTGSLKPAPTKTAWAKLSPSTNGVPIELLNSGGAAPVPPSPPSTVMKSGYCPVSMKACTNAVNSLFV